MNTPETSGAGTAPAAWRRVAGKLPDNLIVYVGFLLIVGFFAVALQRPRVPDAGQLRQYRPPDGDGLDHGLRHDVRALGR